jgi:hypothetical protein
MECAEKLDVRFVMPTPLLASIGVQDECFGLLKAAYK